MIYEFRKQLLREDKDYVDMIVDKIRSEALLKVKDDIKDGKRYVIKLDKEDNEYPYYMTPNVLYTLEIKEIEEEKVELEEVILKHTKRNILDKIISVLIKMNERIKNERN